MRAARTPRTGGCRARSRARSGRPSRARDRAHPLSLPARELLHRVDQHSQPRSELHVIVRASGALLDSSSMKRSAIGVAAHLGWAATAIVAIQRGELRVLRSDRIETAPSNDREAKEPYHVAGGFEGRERGARAHAGRAAGRARRESTRERWRLAQGREARGARRLDRMGSRGSAVAAAGTRARLEGAVRITPGRRRGPRGSARN